MATTRITSETRNGVVYDTRRDMVGRSYTSGKTLPKIYLLPVDNYEPTEWEIASTEDVILLRKKKEGRELESVEFFPKDGLISITDK